MVQVITRENRINPPQPPSVENLLDAYKQGLTAANRSPKTISWYLDILLKYFKFLEHNNLMKPVDTLGREEIRVYILHLQKSTRWPNNPNIRNQGNLSPFSIAGHVRAIKAFWGWLFKEEYIGNNPLAKFPLPRVPKNLIQTIAVSDIKKLLESINRSSPAGERLYCMLLLLIDTGIRVSELVNIKMAEVDFQQGLITVTGKGQKQRQVPFCSVTRKALLKYINGARAELSNYESEYLFPEKYGGHVSINSVQQAIKRLAKKVGLARCYPHLFRHTFATMFIAAGGAGPLLKEIMGHASFQTTEKYIHPKTQDIKMQHQLYSPIKIMFKDN